MIGFLNGTLVTKQPPKLLLDVAGVGYEVEAPMTTFYQLPEVGATLKLHTHLVVREDAHLLYGFFQELDRTLFRTLIKVNGVGPKLALAILSNMNAHEFSVCVANNDVASLVKMPGVGKKTAERLLIEMRDRLENLMSSDTGAGFDFAATVDSQSGSRAAPDAISALVALGYKAGDANKVIRHLAKEGMSSEELIRLALKQL